ncbi:hypothetical protein FRC12_016498 [Ceratobasidium sp. 428]|nr:hypothetical protein FRC12_016498 [Ceratobasidium sp. 428]
MCALALLCPSLVELSRSQYDVWIEPSPASLLLQGLAQTSPGLERLKLLVSSQTQIPYTKSNLFSNLAVFRNLRSLHCSTTMIDSQVVLLLGTLPKLDSLRIDAPAGYNPNSELDNANPEDDLSLDDLMLPPHSFPNLRYLNLQFLPSRVISQLWSFTPLVRQLISIHVRFHPDDVTPFYEPVILNSTICDICRGSTDITELCLDARSEHLYAELAPAVVGCLQQLPLLRRFKLVDAILPTSFGNTNLLVPIIPNVEYLGIEVVKTTFADLVLIAQHLPKLRFLIAYLPLTGWPYGLEGYSITPSPSTLRLGCDFVFSGQTDRFDVGSEHASMEVYINLMAQHLHMLWPNGISCEQEASYHILESSDREYFDLLKSKLNALNPSGFDLPGRQIYEATWSAYKYWFD